jgi:predicted AlkP superfamily pyrophosphatase or phosphodiesterase
MKRAVVMVIDGLRADMVGPAFTPRLAEIIEDTRWFTEQRSVFPSATRVNSASIATGCWPKSHGLAGNAIALDEGDGLKALSVGPPEFRDRLRRATGRTLHKPTMTRRLRAHGGAVIYSNSSAGSAHMQDPDSHGWLFHRDGSFAPGMEAITDGRHPDVTYDATGDKEITRRFCQALAQPGDARFHLLWICEPDHSQHTLELGSPEHREVIAQSEQCAAAVCEAVAALRAAGDDVLHVIASDHGHETVDAIIPVNQLLVEAGLKDDLESSDVVLASSGMGALVYLSRDSSGRRGHIAEWIRDQSWSGMVYEGEDLEQVGQRSDTALAIAFSMAKRDVDNRYGIRGFGHVAGDIFMKSDTPGHGQHGGLGPYETNALLSIGGGGFKAGKSDFPSRTIDIAPTVLRHLDVDFDGMDGKPLPRN